MLLKIDVDEMEQGMAVAESLGGSSKGLPWMTILDASGEELINSDGPSGNVGCPVTESERAYFITMLEKTVQRTSKEGLAKLATALEAYAVTLR